MGYRGKAPASRRSAKETRAFRGIFDPAETAHAAAKEKTTVPGKDSRKGTRHPCYGKQQQAAGGDKPLPYGNMTDSSPTKGSLGLIRLRTASESTFPMLGKGNTASGLDYSLRRLKPPSALSTWPAA